MKRRNFLITMAAAAALPIRVDARGVLTGVDWGAPEGDRGVYNDNLTKLCRALNPVEFAKAYVDAGMPEAMEGYSTNRPAEEKPCYAWLLSGRWMLSECGVPEYIERHLTGLMPTSIMFGRHVDSHEVPGDATIYWTCGPNYAETRYALPDGTLFGFAMGEMRSPVCKFPRDIERRGKAVEREPDFWLHVRGNFVQEYLKAPLIWGDKPDSLVNSECTFGKHQTRLP